MDESVRAIMGIDLTEDTSLVMPSDKNQCTGQQRVLQQVKSIKRTKSKRANDSLPSPTSPASATEYSEPKFQFSPTTAPFSLLSRSSTNRSRWQSTMNSQYTVRRQNGSITQSISNGVKPYVGSQKGNLSRARTVKNASQLQVVNLVRSKSDLSSVNGSKWAIDAMTLQEAVDLLTNSDMHQQLCGASYIQHCTYVDEKARREVCQLGGIEPLIQKLKSDNLDMQQTVAAALRNVVFKDPENKSKVKFYGGIKVILDLVQSNNEVEFQKQLTGLLWNLSSADDLKPELNKTGLVLLTQSILVPYTLESHIHTDKLIEPEIFLNTTGCIRNLSCSSDEDRLSMRNCPYLIDSLMTYLQGQLDRGELDDKSVENCVCALHNLSYKLDKEAPEHFSIIEDFSKQKANEDKSKNSLFSSKSIKNQKELSFPAMDAVNPQGVNWLYNKKSLQMYLSLLRLCQNESTLEACCGALQNLTASKNPVSTVMSQAIEKLNGLPIISYLLNSANQNLQKMAMYVVGNMSRVSNLRATLAKEAFPHISAFISSVDTKIVKADDTIATACRVMQTLAVAEPELCKKVFNRNLIMNLTLLSENMSFSEARQPAGALLYSLWGQKDIYNRLKKQGMVKDTFVNTVTAASYRIISSKATR